jgi:hypothetical protein
MPYSHVGTPKAAKPGFSAKRSGETEGEDRSLARDPVGSVATPVAMTFELSSDGWPVLGPLGEA